MPKKTKQLIQFIRIEVEGGVVVDVSNLPEGWGYELIDNDE